MQEAGQSVVQCVSGCRMQDGLSGSSEVLIPGSFKKMQDRRKLSANSH